MTPDRDGWSGFHQSILTVPTWVVAESQTCQRFQVRHDVLEDATLLHEVTFPGADPVRAVDLPVEDAGNCWSIRLAGLGDDRSVAARACTTILLTAMWQFSHGHGRRSSLDRSDVMYWCRGGVVLTKMFSTCFELIVDADNLQ